MDIEAERKAFQQWFEADAAPLERGNWFRRDQYGFYEDDVVRESWRSWLARATRPLISD